MKELSIEEKAKRYDEAFEVAKTLYCADDVNCMDLETIFPELCESEDERIRKELLGFLRNIPNSNYTCEEMALWLEKQGEQKSIWHNEYEEPQRDSLILLIMQSGTPIVAKIIEPNHTFNHGEKWAYIDDLLEKQGNLKSDEWKEGDVVRHGGVLALVTNGRRAIKSNLEQITIQYPDEWVKAETKERKYFFDELEKQDKQQPADKAEPKFKVKYAGNEYNVFEIKDINGVTYYGIEDEPNHIDYVKAENCEIISGYAIKENGSPYPTKPAMFSEKTPANKVDPKFHEGDWIVWQNKYYKVNYNGCGYELIDQNGLRTSLEYGTVDKSASIFTIEDAKEGDVLADKYSNVGVYQGDKNAVTWNSYCYCGVNKRFYSEGCHEFPCYPATKEQRDQLEKAMADAGYTFDFGKKELKKIEQKSQRMVSAEAKEALYDKPDAWSEKDESIALGIEQLCNCASLLNIAPDKIDKIRTWLKSLKQKIKGE